MSNLSEIDALYKQIFVLDMIEKMKSCSMIWSQVSNTQYSTKLISSSITWNVVLSKLPNGSVTLDLAKNGKHFYSINSGDNAKVAELFVELDDNEDELKDEALLRDIQQLVGCGPIIFDEFMHEGIEISGSASKTSNYSPVITGGLSAGGEYGN
jgi:hypothetical protein